MSEEDAFLDGIAADRTDRTRLLVFADWLADRGDPREEFVRTHARLLDMDGTEPEFLKLEKQWAAWTGNSPFIGPTLPKLNDRWLDALCRVCTTSEVEMYAIGRVRFEQARAEGTEFGPLDDVGDGSISYLAFFHGDALNYDRPIVFVTETVLSYGRDTYLLLDGAKALASCPPITRGRFWRTWRELCRNLRVGHSLPEIAIDNPFLGAQFIGGGRKDEWRTVAIYRDNYFAIYWGKVSEDDV